MDLTFTLVSLICMGMLAALFALGGAFLAYRGFVHRSQGGVTQEWPSTPGEILESTVRDFTTTGPDSTNTTSAVPFVRYRYKVLNHEYEGSSIAQGMINTAAGPDEARNLANRFPVGSSVSVFYNPRHPEESVLEKRAESAGASIVIGIALMVLSVVMICLFAGLAIFGYITILAS